MEYDNQIHERVFSHIEIGIHKYCNVKCPFCPHGQPKYENIMPKGKMSEELYLKILQDLKDINFQGRISFHLMNEPLLSKNLLKFVKLAKEYCENACILIITNGSTLTYQYLLDIFECGVDRISINHYSKNRSKFVFVVLNLLMTIMRINKYNDKPVRLFYLIYLGAYYFLTLDHSTKKYFRIFYRLELKYLKNIVFSISRFYTTFSNRGGNLKTNILREPLKEFCYYPFVQMYISYDGKALICSADYFHQEVIGDVNLSSLLEIWYSDRYKNIRSNLYHGQRKGMLCERCDTYFLYEPDLYYPIPGGG